MKMVRAVLLAGFAWLVGAPASAQVNVPFSTYITGVAAVSSVSLTERIVVMKSGAIQTMTPAQILAAVGGDCTMASPPSIVCTKTNGAPFAASATTDATNANNISSGTLGSARGGAGTLSGALKANGSGVVSVAACADLSDDAPSCSTDTTNATNISSGTLNTLRLPSPFTSGTRRGNTSSFVTYAGSAPVTGHIATYDASGNVIDGGSTGSGTVTSVTCGTGLSGGTITGSGTCAVTGGPFFKVHQAVSQSLSSTSAKINFDTVDFNSAGAWNATTHVYTPLVAGTYEVCANVPVSATFTAGQISIVDIQKNGTIPSGTNVGEWFLTAGGSTGSVGSIGGCTLVQMNGTTDTLEVDASSQGTSAQTSATNQRIQFAAYWIGP